MKISVIIPCYNHGQYITEAVDSVINYQSKDVEIIIINDGSDDPLTIKVLDEYQKKGFKILSHENMGLAYSRNKGIGEAVGEYILPLDADNKIRQDYLQKASKLLDSGNFDIVYSKPWFIGDDIDKRKFQTKAFDGVNLLFGNYIDACALIRKTVWEKVGGFDENMPVQGSEDWEFWISSYLFGFKFAFINEHLFEYRINKNSMIASVSFEELNQNHNYILLKHKNSILDQVKIAHLNQLFYQKDQKSYFRTALKYFVKALRKFFFIVR